MIDLLTMYSYSLVAIVIVAAALALVGSQIAARQSITESLVISQASAFGVSCAVALPAWLAFSYRSVSTPAGVELLAATKAGLALPAVKFIIGLVITALVVRLCRGIMGLSAHAALSVAASGGPESRNTFFIGIFVALTALTFLLTAVSPALEAHVVAAFFGDPTFISPGEASAIAVLAAIVCGFMAWQWRAISCWSFELATFGAPPLGARLNRSQWGFGIAVLVLLYSAVVLMGLLFTLSCLLIPTILIAPACRNNATFSRAIAPVAILGAAGGFIFSLWEGSLPTTPCITLGLAISGLGFTATAATIRFFQRPLPSEVAG